MAHPALRAAAIAGALLIPGAAGANGGQAPSAKTVKPNEVGGVTVTAPEKASPLVDPTTQFVRERLPENAMSEQYPRFRDPVCVRVIGLPDEFDAFIAARVVAVAAQVGAPVGKAGACTPNVNIIFTTSPQALVDDIYRRRDILLGFRWHSQVKKVTTFERPIQSCYLTRTRGADGKSFLEVENALVSWVEKPAGRAGSRLSSATTAEVVHTLILADASKVADAKIGPIADYIAVLALARWQHLERCNRQIATVMNLMADNCEAEAREAATAADLALLTGLYAVDPQENGAMQRATIASAVRKATTGAP